MMVAVALLGVLASVTVPLAELSIQRRKEQELRVALRDIRQAIDAYKRAGDEGRIHRAATSTGYPPTLDVLVDGAIDAREPSRRRIFFLRRLPRDPMHPDASIPATATWGKRAYSSETSNPTEGDDVYDVYSLSKRTGLNGQPYAVW
jgi:general secretion pathway protein G